MNDAARRDRGAALEGPRRAPRRVLGYARVSSAEQALGTSLRDQQDSIKAYASSLGLKVTRFFVEAESAIREKVERREQLRLLLVEAREGDLVLVDKLDRWSRDTEHTLRTIRELRERGAAFFSVAERCDATTAEGDLMLTIRAALAKEEHARIRQRTVGTRKLLREKGYWVEGVVPFGYRRAPGKGLERHHLVIEPDEAVIIRDIFERYLHGESMPRIADKIGRPLYFVQRVLARRMYTGEIETSKGWVKGHHEAIITPGTFARARRSAGERRLGGARPRGTPSETDEWILRDVARCMHCGARMSAAYARRRHGGTDYYYRCAHRCEAIAPGVPNGSYIPVDEVHAPFEAMVLERLAELRDKLGRDEPARPHVVLDFTAKREKLAKKRARYLEAFADGHMSRAELGAALKRLDSEVLRIDAEETAAVPPERAKAYRRAVLANLDMLSLAWTRATDGRFHRDPEPRLRRNIANRLAVEVLIARDESPKPRWRALEELLAEVGV